MLTEKVGYPHTTKGNLLGICLLVSLVLLIAIVLQPITSNEVILLIAAIFPIYLISFNFRVGSFMKMQKSLLEKKIYARTKPGRQERLLVFMGALAFLMIPFISAGFLDSATWLSFIVAVIFGLNLSELSLALQVKAWEKRAGLNLIRYEIRTVDMSGRQTLRERGVKTSPPEQKQI